MKTTTLTRLHEQLKAVMAPFAGYRMPIYYTSAIQEHNCVRNNVGLFDVSHMGKILISGLDALTFISRLTTTNVAKLRPGDVQYSLLLNTGGGIIDDLLIYTLQPNSYMLVINAVNIDNDLTWLNENVLEGEKVEINNLSDVFSILALQGPKSSLILQNVIKRDLSTLKYYTFTQEFHIDGIDVMISATGYTGAGGYEIYFNQDHAPQIWNLLLKSGAQQGIMPIGLAARDTLRLEKAYSLYGHEIDATINPLEAGLNRVVCWGKDFIGKEALLKYKQQGLTKKLKGFICDSNNKIIPRQSYEIYASNDRQIGFITSGAFSPTRKQAIALGYVYSSCSTDQYMYFKARGKEVSLHICKTPFV